MKIHRIIQEADFNIVVLEPFALNICILRRRCLPFSPCTPSSRSSRYFLSRLSSILFSSAPKHPV